MKVRDARILLATEKLVFGDERQILAADTIAAFELAEELEVSTDPDNCTDCHGKGSRLCLKCDGTGECIECGAMCGKCDGEGRIDCENCDGDGEMEPVELENLTKEELEVLIAKASAHA